jgi:hypothetical protein
MRYINILFFVLLTVSNSFSQKIENDTLVISEKSVISPWGMKFEVGGLFQQQFNHDYIDNKIAPVVGISLFYKGLYGKIEVSSIDFNPNKYMHFGNQVFDNAAEFSFINMNMELGYCYNLLKNWSADFRVGFNMTNLFLNNSEEVNAFYSSDMIFGAIFGIGMERYIRLRTNRFIVISAGIDYYTTDYKSLSSDLNQSSINYSLTVGYKFWYRRSFKM